MLYALTVALAFCAGIAAVLGFAVASMHRRLHIRFSFPKEICLSGDLPSLAGLTHGDLTEGNRVELVENGSYLDACVALVDGATESAHFETFLWKSGKMSAEIVRAFSRAARRGVKVRILVDWFGSREMTGEEKRALIEAGAQFVTLRPAGLRHLGWINNRTHRKILVADGARAIVGGHCVDDRWLGNARNKAEFRDQSVLVEGPVVRQIQAAFCENWVEAALSAPCGRGVFPELEKVGGARAHVAYVHPAGGVSAVKLLHHLALHVAKKRLWIQTPYFIPSELARRALIDAVERGVDVRVMAPTIDASDNRFVQHASHHRLAPLLEKGVRVYLYDRTLNHQKVWTIDEEYALIGSTNFDERSFELDDQITLAVEDRALVRSIDERFVRDLAHARQVGAEEFERRPTTEKIGDAFAYLLREYL